MSKNNAIIGHLYEGGYIVTDAQLSYLEGRLLTLVDSWGLKDSQEKAGKDLLRQELWNFLHPCFYVGRDDVAELHIKYEKEGKGQSVANSHGSIPRG